MTDPGYRFGPRLEPEGVRFRLWAPAMAKAALITAPGTAQERSHPMAATGDGWYEVLVAGAGVGTRYLFDVGGLRVPDPASRFQPEDVSGPSEVVDPFALRADTGAWRGRPWAETVLYELHVGTFSETGDFAGVERKLDHLATLGVTAVELMPLADFAGSRNWGYDGVLLFAPDSAYGRPEELARLIAAAHDRGLMVFLDVVYNHFGPEGNYLGHYAPSFFTDDWHTPWGKAIDFRRPEVRRFFIENALYWLEAYGFDGLRLDAVHAIWDPDRPHVLSEIAAAVRGELGAERHLHLVLENDANEAQRLRPQLAGGPLLYDAQWNDDYHHLAQHLMSGDAEGYYADYTDDPVGKLERALCEGFVYQGEPSVFRHGERRGAPSAHLPPTAFVTFTQNHDQVGNRAFGERIAALAPEERRACLTAITLLAPSPPLLFMGEEWASTQPFLYFTDFHDALADAVREGRRREFKRFPAFADPDARARIPDPNAPPTFERSRLDWTAPETAEGRAWLTRYRTLLTVRAREVAPLAAGLRVVERKRPRASSLALTWGDAQGRRLTLLANLGDAPVAVDAPADGRMLYAAGDVEEGGLGAWSAAWWRHGADA